MRLFAQSTARTAAASKPDWAAELYDSFQSGASGQFILYGNVHDRLAIGGRLVSIERYIEDELLVGFQVVFTYDLGNGLTVERGSERLAEWVPAVMQSLPRDPLAAIRFISRFGRYLGNLEAIGKPNNVQVAVLVRGADQSRPTAVASSTAVLRVSHGNGALARHSRNCRSSVC